MTTQAEACDAATRGRHQLAGPDGGSPTPLGVRPRCRLGSGCPACETGRTRFKRPCCGICGSSPRKAPLLLMCDWLNKLGPINTKYWIIIKKKEAALCTNVQKSVCDILLT